MGGTLDGDGVHWLDRFDQSYAAAGVAIVREALRGAFDEAERRASVDEAIATDGLDAMVDRHVAWQFEHLTASGAQAVLSAWSAPDDRRRLREEIVARFVAPIRETAALNVSALNELRGQGYVMGVVSNACGNVDRLCRDLGYTEFFATIVDSRRVGLQKPDPAIYRYAVAQLGLPPARIMMIGDSFDRDVRPAASIGMKTAWLQGADTRPCPDASLVDVTLRALRDLPRALASHVWAVA